MKLKRGTVFPQFGGVADVTFLFAILLYKWSECRTRTSLGKTLYAPNLLIGDAGQIEVRGVASRIIFKVVEAQARAFDTGLHLGLQVHAVGLR